MASNAQTSSAQCTNNTSSLSPTLGGGYAAGSGAAVATSVLLAAALLLVPFAMTAQAQAPASPWVSTDRLTHVQPTADSDFGQAVDVDDDVAVVGDPSQDRAHLYERTGATWLQTQTLDGPAGFGGSVAVNGDTLVVGAPDASAAHVYRSGLEGWEQTATLTVSDASCFGSSVDVDAGTVVAGDSCSTDAVYVFERTSTGWARSAEATVEGESSFGRDVAVGSGTVVVGAGGAAYVLENEAGSGWSDPTELTTSESAGWSVAIDGDALVVGGLGLALVFQHAGTGSWVHTATVEPGDASAFRDGSTFGRSVDLAGDTFVVGAFNDDPSPGAPSLPGEFFDPCVSQFGFGACVPPRPGAAYVFDGSSGAWDQVAKLSPQAVGDEQFGAAVAINADQDEVLVGAPHNFESAIGGAIDVDAEDAVYGFMRGLSA